MPHPLLMALFQDVRSAADAARDLQVAGVAREDLSIVASSHTKEEEIAEQIGGSPGSELEDSHAAGRLGELGGYVLAAIAAGLPGTGALVAAGPLAAELGEAAGHAAGDLKAVLEAAGLPAREADRWQEQIRGGAVLLGVHARGSNRAEIEATLARHSGNTVIHTTWQD